MIERRAPYFAFEGGEACGKSTQIRKSTEYLSEKGYNVLAIREPGTTAISEKVRQILLSPEHSEMTPMTEVLLYAAARAQTVNQIIAPALAEGKLILSDRAFYSSLAYQGAGGLIDIDSIRNVNQIALQGYFPDLVFLFDVDPEEGRKLVLGRGGMDRLESKSMDFHKRVRQGYLDLAKKEPERFRVIPFKFGQQDSMQNQVRLEMDKFIQENNLEELISRK
jgi:dTMP kinase